MQSKITRLGKIREFETECLECQQSTRKYLIQEGICVAKLGRWVADGGQVREMGGQVREMSGQVREMGD
jgi:hypothetical protein